MRRIVAVVSVAVVLAGCTDSGRDRVALAVPAERPTTSGVQIVPTTSDVEIVQTPAGDESDGLINLPVAESRASLLVPSYEYGTDSGAEPDRKLLLLDLAADETVDITNYAEFGAVTFTDSGDAVWGVGDRSLGLRDAASGKRTVIGLPDDIGGSISPLYGSLQAVAGFISVTVGEQDPADGQTVLLNADGSMHCAGPNGTRFFEQAGVLWSNDIRTRMDPATCDVTAGLKLPLDKSVSSFVVDHDNVYVTAFGRDNSKNPGNAIIIDTVRRFDATTGEQLTMSPSLPGQISEMIVQGDEVLVISDFRVRRLDAKTLEVIATANLPVDVAECDGGPRFIHAAGDLYLLDDCSGVLYLLDPATALPQKGWTLPHDDGSDIEIETTSTDEGIWMVDHEQTVVPFLFDSVEQRFERLPVSASIDASIFAMDLALYPGSRN
ncbi:MAG: hypothetical protein JWM47_200 [Acidimicrobiales bacterium]|nr:hypothetical protein [Acidimicrobiales bacterium]